ncbi:MAG: hypothetical protein ACRDYU_00540 [Actinomycetes bacterium]
MQELSMHELDRESVELLPSREALGCYGGGGWSVEDVQNNEQNGLVNVNALNFNHSGLIVVG